MFIEIYVTKISCHSRSINVLDIISSRFYVNCNIISKNNNHIDFNASVERDILI